MKKKQLDSLRLNKKVISDLHAYRTSGGIAATTLDGRAGPGSVGGPCTSIQIPCTHQKTCAAEK